MAMSLSLMRDFVLSVPLQIILPHFMGITGTLWTIPILDIVTIVFVIIFMRRTYRELNSAIKAQQG
jgi:Na+-driven multidrug efflux pump